MKNIKDKIFKGNISFLLDEKDKIETEIKGISRGRIPLEYLAFAMV